MVALPPITTMVAVQLLSLVLPQWALVLPDLSLVVLPDLSLVAGAVIFDTGVGAARFVVGGAAMVNIGGSAAIDNGGTNTNIDCGSAAIVLGVAVVV